METKKFVAIDLGAESGRGMLGEWNGNKIDFKELHRFPTYNVRLHSHIYWDVLAIFSEIKKILCEAKKHGDIAGIGVTTWGVDCGFIGGGDLLLSNPFHYRDKRTGDMPDEVFGIVPKEDVFRQTGIQCMPINTLYQLYSTRKEFPHLLQSAKTLLLMADLFNFFLTGRKVAEYTLTTTSQMYSPHPANNEKGTGRWASELLDALEIPVHFLPEVVPPGTFIGNLSADLKAELQLPDVPVYAVCCHDTASAVAAVPARDNVWAYLSSGTWSLLGVEIGHSIINDKSLRYNFTNEGGYGETFRFLKNIMGLWILQECRKEWTQNGRMYAYEELWELASAAQPFFSFIDVNDKQFLFPGRMQEKICSYCERTGQAVPHEIGQIARVVLESLAMEYRRAIQNLEELIENKIETLHIVGGGSQNNLLSQFTASAIKKSVITGPVEATAAGNIMVQAMAQKEISDISRLREIVRNSFPLFVFQPRDTSLWDENYEKFMKLVGSNE